MPGREGPLRRGHSDKRGVLEWHRTPVAQQTTPHQPPLVVLLSWMFASSKITSRYAQLVNSLGWDCAIFYPVAGSMWVPVWSTAHARSVLNEVESELAHNGTRPLVFAAFSGAPKAAYSDILSMLGPVYTPHEAAQKAAAAAHSAAGTTSETDLQCPLEAVSEFASSAVPQSALSSPPPLSSAAARPPAAVSSASSASASAVAAGRIEQALKAAIPAPWEHYVAHEVCAAAASDAAAVGECLPYCGPSSSPLQQAHSAAPDTALSGLSTAERQAGAYEDDMGQQGLRNQYQGAKKRGHGLLLKLARAAMPMQWLRGMRGGTGDVNERGNEHTQGRGAGQDQHNHHQHSRHHCQQQQQQQPQQDVQRLGSVSSAVRSVNQAAHWGRGNDQHEAQAQARYPLCARCLCGQWFDSGPVDFTSDAGARMLARATTGSRYAACNFAACTLDFGGLEAFEAQRGVMWQRLACAEMAARGPTFVVYSWDDMIADPIRVHRLACALRARRCHVIELGLSESEHCGHLRRHPQAYAEGVKTLLARSQASFDARSGPGQDATEQQHEVQRQQQQQQRHHPCSAAVSGSGLRALPVQPRPAPSSPTSRTQEHHSLTQQVLQPQLAASQPHSTTRQAGQLSCQHVHSHAPECTAALEQADPGSTGSVRSRL